MVDEASHVEKKKGIYVLPCTGSNSTGFSAEQVSNSDVVRLNIDIDLVDVDLGFLVFDPAALFAVSSSSPSSPSSSALSLLSSLDRVIPATGFS